MSKPRHQWERALQKAVVQFHATMVVDIFSAILVAIPNGELRDEKTAFILTGKRTRKTRTDIPALKLPEPTDEELLRPAGQGVLSGANDLLLILGGPKTLYLETKIPKTALHEAGKFSRPQRVFRGAVEALGHDYRELNSVEQYQAILVEHGVRLRIRSVFPVLRPASDAPLPFRRRGAR